MRHNGLCLKPIRCCCYLCDLSYDCQITDTVPYFQHRATMYGHRNSYAGFNKVVVQDPEEVERLLVEENGRGPYLGLTDFALNRLTPDVTDHNRTVLLLVMDGVEKGKPVSDHTAFRAALLSLTTSQDCMNRVAVKNPMMQRYIELLKQDIAKCTSSSEIPLKALPPYLLRTLHWGVLGLDLNNEEFNLVYDTYYKGTSSYVFF
jgi:hypothetical protein